MKNVVLAIILYCLVPAAFGVTAAEPAVIYWDSVAGKAMRARIPADAGLLAIDPDVRSAEHPVILFRSQRHNRA